MSYKLNRVHKGLFDLVEDQGAHEEHQQHGGQTVTQHAPADGPGAQEGSPKGLHNGGDRVDQRHPAPARGNRRDGVDDGRGVHPQLHAEGDQEAQVTVLGGQGGDDDPKAQPQTGHQEDQHGQQQGIDGDLHRRALQHEEQHKAQEEHKLDAEGDHVREQHRDRHHQAWEIDLVEDLLVGDESIGGRSETFRKIGPDNGAGHIKQERRQVVGGQGCDLPEHHGEDQGRQQGLDQEPQRAEDGLLVIGDEVTPHEQEDQVAVTPDFVQAQVPPGAFGLDDEVPGFSVGCLIHRMKGDPLVLRGERG